MSRKSRKHLDHDSDVAIEKVKKEPRPRIKVEELRDVRPLTKTQQMVFDWFNDSNLFLHGMAGVGKTYLALFLALRLVLKGEYKKIYIVRSIVPTVDVGFLPGSIEEKIAVYEKPYQFSCTKLLGKGSYERLKEQKLLEFVPTSFIRGTEFENAIVFFDEVQNANFHELDSVITRCGENTKIIFSGDYSQTDLKNRNDRHGLFEFLKIIDEMPDTFKHIEFTTDDIVRGGLVKQYLIAKSNLGIGI